MGALELLTWLAIRDLCGNGSLSKNAILQQVELTDTTVAIAGQIAGGRYAKFRFHRNTKHATASFSPLSSQTKLGSTQIRAGSLAFGLLYSRRILIGAP